MNEEELESLKRDAARYRWLRKEATNPYKLKAFIAYGISPHCCANIAGEVADSRIDEFMNQEPND
jgi:hypothetical protein